MSMVISAPRAQILPYRARRTQPHDRELLMIDNERFHFRQA